jgi:type II secretion system protein G
MKTKSRGFTLIELLVVIAIIGLLASVVMASLNSVRAKGRDARRISDFKELSKALALYYDKYGKYPNEAPYGSGPWMDNYNNMAQQLVNEGFIGAIPQRPEGGNYQYYNYQGTAGGLLVTELEAAPNTTTGIPPSCRPWGAGQNWCSQSSSKEYCICNSY